MSESSSSSEEEYVDTSIGNMPANNSASLKKPVGGSAQNEVSVAKRPREGEEAEKRVKKYTFKRLWSEEDEIKLLEGVMDYRKESGNDDTKEAYEEVSKSISFDVSKIQFKEKIRSLKKKFDRQIIKAKKKGEDPTFVKSHDGRVFELSKLLWGAHEEAAVNFKGNKSKKRRRKSEDDEEEEEMNKEELVAEERDMFMTSSVVQSLTRFGMDESVALQGWSWLDVEIKKKFEEDWKAYHVQEAELHSNKTGSIRALMTEIGEVFKSNL